jgi:hypothetical protein
VAERHGVRLTVSARGRDNRGRNGACTGAVGKGALCPGGVANDTPATAPDKRVRTTQWTRGVCMWGKCGRRVVKTLVGALVLSGFDGV